MPKDEEGQNDRLNVVAMTDTNPETAKKRLPYFIKSNTAEIISEWEAFARTLMPSADGVTPHALRDHIHQILAFVMSDMASYQTPAEQKENPTEKRNRAGQLQQLRRMPPCASPMALT